MNYMEELKQKQDKFTKDIESINETGKDSQGSSWEYCTKTYIWCEVFGFCGCYDPDTSFKEVYDAMIAIDEEKQFELRNNSQLATFIYYWLDTKSITEHGGSIPGWLTGYGKELLKEMKLVIDKEMD